MPLISSRFRLSNNIRSAPSWSPSLVVMSARTLCWTQRPDHISFRMARRGGQPSVVGNCTPAPTLHTQMLCQSRFTFYRAANDDIISSMWRCQPWCVVVFVMFVFSPNVSAQQARALRTRRRKHKSIFVLPESAFRNKDYAVALQLYEKAYALDHAPWISFQHRAVPSPAWSV